MCLNSKLYLLAIRLKIHPSKWVVRFNIYMNSNSFLKECFILTKSKRRMQCGWMDVYLRAISLLKHCGNLHYVSLYKPSLNVLMMKIAFMFDFVGVQGN